MGRLTSFSLDETTGFLPRVAHCQNGSYCCDSNPRCCEEGFGVFLDNTGEIVDSQPTSSFPSVSSSSSVTATSTSATSSSPPLNNTTSSGLSTGAKIGLGVGLSFGVLILCGIIAILVFQYRKRKREVQPEVKTFRASTEHRKKESDFKPRKMEPKELQTPVPELPEPVAELPAERGWIKKMHCTCEIWF